MLGTVTAVSGSQVNLTTAFGDSLVLTTSSSTTYSYPGAVCATANASCVSVGQIVTTDLNMLGSGSLGVTSLSYVGSSGSQLVKALVLSTDNSGATPSAQLLLQREVNVSSLTAGQIATVSLPADVSYSVGVASYPAISTATFASAADLMPGQELIVSVGSDLAIASSPSFSTNTVYLEPSQIIGTVASVDTTLGSLEVTGLSGLFTGSRPVVQEMAVQTGMSTAFVGFNPSSLAAVSVGQFVAAKGPLFYDSSNSAAVLAAVQLRARAAGN